MSLQQQQIEELKQEIQELKSWLKTETYLYQNSYYLLIMTETITIPKQEYEELLEEVGILRNKGMMEAIRESDEAKEKGTKTWELKTHKLYN